MSKIKKFEKEINNELESLGFYISYCGSDDDSKMGLYKPKPNPLKSDEWIDRYTSICEFAVGKVGRKEYFIVWDYRMNQPFEKNSNCTYNGSFGRYDFNNKSEFINHIQTDYGLTRFENHLLLEKEIFQQMKENNIKFNEYIEEVLDR